MPSVAFTLNGRRVDIEFEAGERLLSILRERFGITSVKDGCAPEGVCGACTILLDGRPALACLLDPTRIAGRDVVTLEGLPERKRQLVAESFVRSGAVQCGFCTPGIAVRAAHLR